MEDAAPAQRPTSEQNNVEVVSGFTVLGFVFNVKNQSNTILLRHYSGTIVAHFGPRRIRKAFPMPALQR